MTTETRANLAVEAIKKYRVEHPIRTLNWRGQVVGLIGTEGEDGVFEFAVGVTDTRRTVHTPFYMRRMTHILGDVGLNDIAVNQVDFHPYYLDPNYSVQQPKS